MPLYSIANDRIEIDPFGLSVQEYLVGEDHDILILQPTAYVKVAAFDYLEAGSTAYRLAGRQLRPDLVRSCRRRAHQILQSDEFGALQQGGLVALEAIGALSKVHPYFSFVYFECLSQVVILASSDEYTNELSQRGILNGGLATALWTAVVPATERFDATLFTPTVAELQRAVTTLNETNRTALDTEFVGRTAGDLACFRFRHEYSALASRDRIEKLTGQLLAAEQAADGPDHVFWPSVVHDIVDHQHSQPVLLVNTTTIKGELGLVPNTATTVEAWRATADSNGELKIVEPLGVLDVGA